MMIATSALRRCQRKTNADQTDDDAFLDQLLPERVDGAKDQLRAVINRHDPNSRRKRVLQLLDLLFDAFDDRKRIFAVAHDHDAADGLTLAVELGQAFPQVRPQFHRGYLVDGQRSAIGSLERNLPQVVQRMDVAPAPDEILRRRNLQRFAAHIAVAFANRIDHIVQADAVIDELVRIDVDLVLLHEAADAGHLGHAFDRTERIFERPILQAAQLGEIVLPGVIHQGVLINPADTGGIRPQSGRDAGGQRFAHAVEVFEHPRPRPINIRAILEDHVDKRPSEHRQSAHGFHFGRAKKSAGDRIGDLVFDQARGCGLPNSCRR